MNDRRYAIVHAGQQINEHWFEWLRAESFPLFLTEPNSDTKLDPIKEKKFN